MAEEKKGIGTGFKIAIAAVVIIGLSVGGYFIYDYAKPKAVAPPEGGGTGGGGSDKGSGGSGGAGGSTGGGGSISANDSFPLKKGSKGSNVAKLQGAFNKFYRNAKDFTPLDTDGEFGSKTLAALQRVFGKDANEAGQSRIDWLNSNTYKPKSK